MDYGILINSIGKQMVDDATGVIWEGTEYAEVLEFGGVHMAARPHMTPAAEAAREGFLKRMGELEWQLR